MAPPIECVTGSAPDPNPNPKTDPDPNPKSNNNVCSAKRHPNKVQYSVINMLFSLGKIIRSQKNAQNRTMVDLCKCIYLGN